MVKFAIQTFMDVFNKQMINALNVQELLLWYLKIVLIKSKIAKHSHLELFVQNAMMDIFGQVICVILISKIVMNMMAKTVKHAPKDFIQYKHNVLN